MESPVPDRREVLIALGMFILVGLLLVGPLASDQQKDPHRGDFQALSLQAEARLLQTISDQSPKGALAILDPLDKRWLANARGGLDDPQRLRFDRCVLALAATLGRQDTIDLLTLDASLAKAPAAPAPLAFLWNPKALAPSIHLLKAELDLLPFTAWTRYKVLGAWYQRQGNTAEAATQVELAKSSEATLVARIAMLTLLYLVFFAAGVVFLYRSASLLSRHSEPASSLAVSLFRVGPLETASIFSFWLFSAFLISSIGPAMAPDDPGAPRQILLVYSAQALLGFLLIYRLGTGGVQGGLKRQPIEPGAFMRAVGLGLSDIRLRTLYWALGGFAAALPTVFGLTVLSQLLLGGGVGEANPLIPMLVAGTDWETRLPLLLNVVLLAPLFEEFLFRGFLLSQFRRYAGETGAVMLSSLLFGAMHMSPDALLPLTGLGIILAVVARASGGLWAPVLLHALWNAATMAGVICLYD